MVADALPALMAHLRMTLRLLMAKSSELGDQELNEMRLGTTMLRSFIAHRRGRELSATEANEVFMLAMAVRLALRARGVPEAAPEEVEAVARLLAAPGGEGLS